MAELVVIVNKLRHLQNTLVVRDVHFQYVNHWEYLFFHYIAEIVKARITASFKIMRKEALVLVFYLLI